MNVQIKYYITKVAQIFVLDVLILIGAISINLLPSIYNLLVDYFFLDSPAKIMLEEAFFVLLAATVALLWGYLIDRVNRKLTLQISLTFLIIGFVLCTIADQFVIFIIGRMITAIGYGALMPIIYSILADYISAKYWSTTFGFLAFIIALGNVVGNFLSGFITPLNIWGLGWKFSFLLLGFITLVLGVLLIFFRIPQRGASSFEIISEDLGKGLREGHLAYNFTIKISDLKAIWKIPTNRKIVILSFFAVIPGAIMSSFLVYYLSTFPFSSFPDDIRIQIAQIFAAAVGIGYFLGTLFLGLVFDLSKTDVSQKRARYTYRGLIIAIPLFIFAFLCITPVNFSDLRLDNELLTQGVLNPRVYYEILNAIFFYHPVYVFYFISLFFGSFFVASLTINRTPALLEINLPEHMGTSQALLNFSDQYGKGFTLIFLAFQFTIFEYLFQVVNGKLLLILSILWYIIPLLMWRRIEKIIIIDTQRKRQMMELRSKEVHVQEKLSNY